ncbi:type 2 isopentenyl-diphosphate Delta-isomerase [Natronogracilivirga saccharolytica]|uniref:Isopentenyl-diphosphate delta-isomerase n=1 Tax=Natronogracilivirga saccharolytica TaxID=2812953 RepID=A0A8J7SCU8_9BACT|nr:type 2 isopentenyl-diphosphate Delta-isomerase [Natronogracilivirga saccharolytica]MBP3193706.1 type 2 isopentenyl-diphosphate Delta-isomerase [Natronogracilivirga saccharolytica]
MPEIEQRKKDHLDITTSGQAGYAKTSGFERFDFIHNALPEVDYDEISCETRFLNRWFSFPLFISSMTGGHHEATPLNAIIAAFCEAYILPFGVGSQRAMLEDPSLLKSFSIVREEAPSAFIASNIGGTQLIGGLEKEKVSALVDTIRADAIIVHLNPLQELRQKNGDRNFSGVREGIRKLVSEVEIPVIVKETGAGLSQNVIEQLIDCGVAAVDIAGAGGTSWGRVENIRNASSEDHFTDDWGIPTSECLLAARDLAGGKCEIIASGGIRHSSEIAKSLCMGAVMAATAQPVIRAVKQEGYEGLEKLYKQWEADFKTIMCLLGCERPTELDMIHLRRVSLR